MADYFPDFNLGPDPEELETKNQELNRLGEKDE